MIHYNNKATKIHRMPRYHLLVIPAVFKRESIYKHNRGARSVAHKTHAAKMPLKSIECLDTTSLSFPQSLSGNPYINTTAAREAWRTKPTRLKCH